MIQGKQNGAVLAIGLILLLLMTILGSMSMSRVNISERLAGSEREINSAFQAAESALLEGERWINDLTNATPPATVSSCVAAGLGCQTVIWDADSGDGVRVGNTSWQSINWDAVGRTFAQNKPVTETLQQLSEPPKYVIEYLGPESGAAAAADMYYYRITSRARGTTPASEVILQSVYRRQFP